MNTPSSTKNNPFAPKDYKPRYTRRAPWHDYRSRCVYMITISKAQNIPVFSFIEGSPQEPIVRLTPVGHIIEVELQELPQRFDDLEIIRYVIMPDHIHFIVHIKRPTNYHLGKAIGSFKGRCSRRMWQLQEFNNLQVFETFFHDRILMEMGQLDVMKRYVNDNPRRLLIKRQYPDLFRRRVTITLNGVKYDALGNIFLLRNPLIEQVMVSRRFSDSELAAFDRRWKYVIAEGGVLVSPFISPREKAYRELAVENGGKIIFIEKNGMGERYKPVGRFFDLCSEGRLLIVAPIEYHLEERKISRETAMHLNGIALRIAKGQFEVSLTI